MAARSSCEVWVGTGKNFLSGKSATEGGREAAILRTSVLKTAQCIWSTGYIFDTFGKRRQLFCASQDFETVLDAAFGLPVHRGFNVVYAFFFLGQCLSIVWKLSRV